MLYVFDAFNRGSNIIFYWEEKEMCLEKYSNKLLLNEENIFGDIVYNVIELEKIISRNLKEEQLYKNKAKYKRIVKFDDNLNTQRVLKHLKKEGII